MIGPIREQVTQQKTRINDIASGLPPDFAVVIHVRSSQTMKRPTRKEIIQHRHGVSYVDPAISVGVAAFEFGE
ncbi:MAG: hypothetical protein KA323_14835 [Planctomycetes bacterium]|jgi:hypothetical protein|nr:hypothetical protein [Planctomycetota bacterium]NMD36189.1 hypothetical protein [Planctomycetota bacterium]OQC19310.1 MAG: hypothetical protein BWX69_02808 [Planctomycetes bacterium ADurb.Bin069]HQM61532.1 hypothetical protein [Planctomycetota bacterium]